MFFLTLRGGLNYPLMTNRFDDFEEMVQLIVS